MRSVVVLSVIGHGLVAVVSAVVGIAAFEGSARDLGGGSPHSIKGNHVKSILWRVRSLPEVQGETRDETASELVAK